MLIRIEGFDLPGNTCGPSPDRVSGHSGIHVGVQRRGRPDELLGLYPGDSAQVSWDLECVTKATPAGVEVTGPYVQGRPGDRFVYLSWGTVGEDGVFAMFRRAKLMLSSIDPETLDAGVRAGRLLARVRLTDAKGNPTCARLRAPDVEWSVPGSSAEADL